MSMEAINAAIVGAATNVAASEITSNANYNRMRDYFDYTQGKNQQAQYDMIKMSPQLMVQGYKQAGLNPAGISSSYQGSGASGDSNNASVPINNTLIQDYMAAENLRMQQEINAANVRKVEAEAANVEKQNDWFDDLSGASLRVSNAQEALLKNQSEEIKTLLPEKLNQLVADIDFTNIQKDYQSYLNEAMNSEYDFNGVKIKGKDIPNFKELFALAMAEKTLAVDWYSAKTSRMQVEGDWQRLLTIKWLRPIVDDLTPSITRLGTSVGSDISQIVDSITKIRESIQGFGDNLGKKLEGVLNFNPFGSIKDYLKNNRIGWQGDILPGLK